uniref:Putative toxin-antitoxin system toxin component, PIN family n=1 Tax=Candidatus Kentrum sp. FM TaxID=2126340 RepID=A0A450RWQ1_9GAMM|nr:MAG: putative toxin-antitoxin system toxin component, PIN family [Candidatus Kentron sp. FM]VFJ55056.1 MAG: putative toxin-antitoxin system toxin component, PIN family [Candidatus Kentron sp. FM]VFK07180.1 MAG: putative toxin-antitoxin system toxin component, PIN family [Candidatus Kentron sp. FM]
MIKPRLVIDTNIYISALLNGNGNPARLIVYAGRNAELVFSDETMRELREVIRRPKFRFYLSIDAIDGFIKWTESKAKIVCPEKLHAISRDKKDNKFIDAAIAGKADFIVSGDKRHLLSLGQFDGIPIISVSDFLGRARQ